MGLNNCALLLLTIVSSVVKTIKNIKVFLAILNITFLIITTFALSPGKINGVKQDTAFVAENL